MSILIFKYKKESEGIVGVLCVNGLVCFIYLLILFPGYAQ